MKYLPPHIILLITITVTCAESKCQLQCPPKDDGAAGICIEGCSSSDPSTCPEGKLCCSNGCGHVCTTPVSSCKPPRRIKRKARKARRAACNLVCQECYKFQLDSNDQPSCVRDFQKCPCCCIGPCIEGQPPKPNCIHEGCPKG